MTEWRGERRNPDGSVEKFRAEDMGGYICIEQLTGFRHDDEAAHLHLPREEFLRWAHAQQVTPRFGWLGELVGRLQG